VASGTHKTDVKIDLVYQAAACLSNAIPAAIVHNSAAAVDTARSTSLSSQLVLGALTGVAVGRYVGNFTPNTTGDWTVTIKDNNSAGEVSKMYEVCGYDIATVGNAVSAIDTANIASQLLLTQSAVNVATASDGLLQQSSIISSVKSAQLVMQSTLGSYISNVESAVDLISSPAMVS